MRNLICGFVMFAILANVVACADDEEKIPIDKLPAKVTDAVKAKFAGAEWIGASKEKEDGKDLYEVAIKFKGTRIDVILKPDGTIEAIERQIKASDLPEPVTQALQAKYPRATYKVVEEITKGEAITYEILLVSADNKTFEVTFDPKGKLLEEESKDKKKNEQ